MRFFLPRFVTLLLLWLILMNPTHRREHRLPPQKPEVIFLIDASRSMGLDEPDSRMTLAGLALEELQAFLASDAAPRVQNYSFGNALASIIDLSEATPHADKSELSAALEQLPSRFGREPPKGVVVFSDGQIDDASQLGRLAEDYRSLQIPVHVFPVGDDRVRGDVAIDDLVLPPRAPAGTKVPVRGSIRSSGFDGQRAVVRLISTRRPDIEPLATLPITLNDAVSQSFEMIVEAQPELGELLLEVEELDGEATQINNRVPFEIAQANRKIRVLYMEGTGNHEYRWLRDALQEDPDIECLAMVADQQYVERQRLV
ncbi:MAG: VWA domain-containing protein, partial [Acidobacteria bacterium]|nr:VWA domain-containing protein [Acidobacteriota bacterium]